MQSGTISVDFGLGSGSINMVVDHIPSFPYTISGALNVVPADNEIFDQFPGLNTTTSAPGSACNPMCDAFLDGGFAGPSNAGVPDFVGIEYDIQDTDVVMGVAGFEIVP